MRVPSSSPYIEEVVWEHDLPLYFRALAGAVAVCSLVALLAVFAGWPFYDSSVGQRGAECLAFVACMSAVGTCSRTVNRVRRIVYLSESILEFHNGWTWSRVPLVECYWFLGFTSNDWESPHLIGQPAICITHRSMFAPNGRQAVACGLTPELRAKWMRIFREYAIPRGRDRGARERIAMVVSAATAFSLTRAAFSFTAVAIGQPVLDGLVSFLVAATAAIVTAWYASIYWGNDVFRHDRSTLFLIVVVALKPIALLACLVLPFQPFWGVWVVSVGGGGLLVAVFTAIALSAGARPMAANDHL